MSLREFFERVEIANRREVSQWRHTRLIVAASCGVQPREVIELPGDWDLIEDAPLNSDSHSEEIAARMLKLGIGKVDKNGKVVMDVKPRGAC